MMDPVPNSVSAAAVASVEGLSVANIDDPSAELGAIAGAVDGEMRRCYQPVAGANEWTLYAWDSASSAGASTPYRINGASGQWIAVAGKYGNGARNFNSTLAVTGAASLTLATGTALAITSTTAGTASAAAVTVAGGIQVGTSGSATSYFGGQINIFRAASTNNVQTYQVTGEAAARYVARIDGLLGWGDGTNTRDVGLIRNAAGILEINTMTVGTFADLKLANLTASGAGAFTGALSCAALTATSVAATGTVALTGTMTVTDAMNIAVGSTTGTKIGTATTQKIGLWNVAPVAQYATTGTSTGFTAGAGTTATSLSTFTGNTGSTAYTTGDIVRALKLCGIIAA